MGKTSEEGGGGGYCITRSKLSPHEPCEQEKSMFVPKWKLNQWPDNPNTFSKCSVCSLRYKPKPAERALIGLNRILACYLQLQRKLNFSQEGVWGIVTCNFIATPAILDDFSTWLHVTDAAQCFWVAHALSSIVLRNLVWTSYQTAFTVKRHLAHLGDSQALIPATA